MQQAKAGITPEVIDAMTAMSGTLSKGRKKRVVSATVATAEELEAFSLLSSHPLHKTTQVHLAGRIR